MDVAPGWETRDRARESFGGACSRATARPIRWPSTGKRRRRCAPRHSESRSCRPIGAPARPSLGVLPSATAAAHGVRRYSCWLRCSSGGLWHGAAWTFVLWGGLHGAALVVNAAWNRIGAAYQRYTFRPFPEWMYDDDPWNDFREHFDVFTLEQAARQLATMIGMRRIKYGRDGYTNFLPDDRAATF